MPQIHGNQVLQLERKFLKLTFRVSYKKQQKIICVEAKNLDRIDICLNSWETEISHGDQVLSPRYFFLQRMITEHMYSDLLMGEKNRSNSVEEINP